MGWEGETKGKGKCRGISICGGIPQYVQGRFAYPITVNYGKEVISLFAMPLNLGNSAEGWSM